MSRNSVGQYTVADWFKQLIDKTKLPCLLMGLPRCEAILQANDQLRRRFSAKLELPKFSMDSDCDAAEFRAVLQSIDSQYPIKLKLLNHDHDLLTRIFYATDGRIGYLKKLLLGALELALIHEANAIDAPLLAEAFCMEIWSDCGETLNPFAEKFVFRDLNSPGEPFYLLAPRIKNKNGKGVSA